MMFAISYWNKIYIQKEQNLNKWLIDQSNDLFSSNPVIIFIEKQLKLHLTLYIHYNFHSLAKSFDRLVLALRIVNGR